METDLKSAGQRRETDRTPPAPAFFRIQDVLRITALSKPTLYRRIAARRFPAPVRLGGRACGWSSSALQTWIADPEGYQQRAEDRATTKCGRSPNHT